MYELEMELAREKAMQPRLDLLGLRGAPLPEAPRPSTSLFSTARYSAHSKVTRSEGSKSICDRALFGFLVWELWEVEDVNEPMYLKDAAIVHL